MKSFKSIINLSSVKSSIHLEYLLSVDDMANVFTVFHPFYLILKLVGVFPKSFVGPVEKGLLKTKCLDVIPPILVILWILYLIHEVTTGSHIINESLILMVAWNYSLIFELCLIILQSLYEIHHRESIVKFLGVLSEFDRELLQHNHQIDYKTHRKGVRIAIFLFVLFNFVKDSVFHILNYFFPYYNYDWWIVFSNIVVVLYATVFLLQVSLANCSLQERFRIINDLLKCV
jgi:hypothetical protein